MNKDLSFLFFNDSERQYADATCLKSEYILSQFRKSRCRNFILIVDACHSAAFFNNVGGLPKGLVALTSCDEDEQAKETKDGGMFSNIILKGIRSEYIDANRDGKITFSELFDFITEEIGHEKNETLGTPKKWEWNVDQDICFFDSPRPVFISYKRSQKELVTRISQSLQAEDISTFVDQEKIRLGDDWRELLEQTIINSRAFLFVLDKEILHSEVSNWELAIAHKHNVPILPIMVEEVKVHAMFEAMYGHYNRVYFDREDYDNSIGLLTDHILAIRVDRPDQ